MKPIVLALSVVPLLSACYTCDFLIDDVCVVTLDGVETAFTEEDWRGAIERSADFWNLKPTGLLGLAIIVHPGRPRVCRGAVGCYSILTREIHMVMNVGPGIRDCPAWLLPHEMGHVAHPLAMGHDRQGWRALGAPGSSLTACLAGCQYPDMPCAPDSTKRLAPK